MTGPVPQPGVMRIAPYRGGEGTRSGHALAANENPRGAGAAARDAYRALADQLHVYPDGGAVALRQAIAGAEGLDAARIVCGNGSDELIGLLCHAYAGPGDEVLHTAHGFLMYRISALAAGAEPVAVAERELRADVDALLERAGPKTRLVFLANPNNPTGSWLTRAELERLASGLPEHTLLVIDAAYAEYVDHAEYSSGAELAGARADVVMTRTFSKIHGLAALRTGWAYCPEAVAAVLHRMRGPFNANAAAQAAATAATGDAAHVAESRAHNTRLRAELAAGLEGLGICIAPSAANFVLARFAGPEAAARADQSLRADNILVRRMDPYGLPESLRITVGTEAAVRDTLAALTAHAAEAVA